MDQRPHQTSEDVDINAEECELLATNPHALLLRYQEMFRIVVKQAIADHMLRPGEHEEVLQTINAEMLTRIPTIQGSYDGRALLRTYVARLALNVCRKHYHDRTRHESVSTSDIPNSLAEDTVTEGVYIRDAVNLFQSTMELYGRQRGRVLLLLKLYFRYPLTEDDVRLAYPQARTGMVGRFVERFASYEGETGKDVMADATPFLNALERKTRVGESYRHIAKEYIDEICSILNGNPPTGNFTKESLRVLVDNYFYPFLPGS